MLRALFKMTESASKRVKLSPAAPSPAAISSIGTHNGHFHADEALAVHMLRMLYPSTSLVRTRDPSLLGGCSVVVDVGGEYDAARHRYDHHQRGFDATFPGRPTKLSSAGLVFLHFGKEIVRSRMGGAPGDKTDKMDVEAGEAGVGGGGDEADGGGDVGLVWDRMYAGFVEALDAHDNGIDAYDPEGIRAAGLEKRFKDGGFTLGAMVGRHNASWNTPVPESPEQAQADEDSRFVTASRRIGEEFESALDFYIGSWLPARSDVQAAFARRAEHDAQGRMVVLASGGVPWKEHLYSLEEAEGTAGQVVYVLYPEKAAAAGSRWRVQAVPVSSDSFQSRKGLPEGWRGFRDEELDGKAGVEGCVFVHASGFIGGNKTFEGALAMARKALEA